jgi:NAD(P)-dependent dehydrogenase (short-subunit alcohol dehydrogenase family)
MELDGKTAVVTGAARGIGYALAEAFLDAGMRVLATDVDGARLGEAVEALDAGRGRVRAVVTDVSDPDDVRRLAGLAFTDGPVHLLCNNAGTVVVGNSWDLPLDAWTRVLGVNLWGPIHTTREFIPRMLASGVSGSIVNIASMASLLARPGIAPYNVSKHGLLALGETLQHELEATGAPIGVVTVFPGRVDTELGAAPTGPDVRSPAEVAQRVIRAVRDDERFVFTHPDRVTEAAARANQILGRRA